MGIEHARFEIRVIGLDQFPCADPCRGAFRRGEWNDHGAERTALVSVTHFCYRNGSRLDIEAIARLAHDCGARWYYVDRERNSSAPGGMRDTRFTLGNADRAQAVSTEE